MPCKSKELKEIAAKLQDLVRDCQYYMNQTDDPELKDFFGHLARENGRLAHSCMDKIHHLK